jgi:hypothetical protein
MSAPRSTTLFHFTKSLDVLESILKQGFLPHYSLEDIGWIGSPEVDAIAFPVVCFCDIPLSRITDHVQFYGQFGIGMKQDWATANGLNPIIYVSQTSHVASLLKKVVGAANILQSELKDSSYIENTRRLIGYCKPVAGQISIQGTAVTKAFYQESEWRFLATHDKIRGYLTRARFDDQGKRDAANKLAAQYCTLSVTPQDVKYLFVENESDIPDLVNFVNSQLGSYPQRDVQTLITRIVCQDTIKNDI